MRVPKTQRVVELALTQDSQEQDMAVSSRCTVAGLLAGLSFVIATSCGKEPATPSPQPIIRTLSLAMEGPQQVALGASAQFTVMAHRSDGSTVNATNQVSWFSSRTSILTISPTGLATGRAAGEAAITASIGAIRSTRQVVVLQDGTFLVTGRVTEVIQSMAVPVPGAAIQMTSGSANAVAFTDSDGRYRLYGVAGDVELRARKSAYRDHVQRVVVTDHQTVDFELITTLPFPEVEGSYTLTIAAASSCASALPEAARVRTYAASVARSGRQLNVSLGGATFIGTNNRFNGRIDPTFISFNLGYYYYYYYYGPIIEEQLATDQRLGIAGYVTAEASGNGVSGILSGYLRLTTDRGVRIASCTGGHRFELRR